MSRHPDAELSAYATGSLAEHERARVEQHLAGCGACRAAVEDFHAIVESLATAPAPPPVAWPRYRAELRARRDAHRRTGWRERWLSPLPLGVAGALVAASVALVVYLGPGSRPSMDLAAIEYDGLAGRIEMIDKYPVVEQLDMLEDFDVIRNLDRLAPTREG
jgi:anti-sigma factor RsiW